MAEHRARPSASEDAAPTFSFVLVGDGTAEHPDAGLLIGNGHSPDRTTCGTRCRGGFGGRGGGLQPSPVS